MSHDRLRVAIITASTREGRFGPVVTRWFTEQVGQRDDIVADVIDLAAIDLPSVLPRTASGAVAEYVERIDRADAYVVVTPEYNHGYPASLKQAIDIPRSEWKAKPVGFVSYGGLAGGLRAVEQLRQVFAEVHVVSMRDTVSFHNYWTLFDADGQHLDSRSANLAAATMLDELTWWGGALRRARDADQAEAA
ncbi:MAG: NAD(P)H-dependent oxidoreductase [Acidimicrobiales bacterium]